MSGHARKRPIKFEIKEIEKALKKEGLTSSKIKAIFKHLFSSTVSVDELITELFPQESRPSVMLRGARHKENLTQTELANKLGTNQPAIAAMENGTRGIGKEMAHRLARVLGVDYRLFL